jgi:lysophospholipase L1-like esterase
MTKDVFMAWVTLRDRVLSLRQHGGIVIDCGQLLSGTIDGALTGTYAYGLSDDDVHPNDAGHRLIADELDSVLRSVFEKDRYGELGNSTCQNNEVVSSYS